MAKFKASIGSVLFDVINYSVLVLLCLTMTYPFIYMISVSVSDFYEVMVGHVKLFPKGPLQLISYRALFSNQDIPRAFMNSILYAVTGVIFTLIISSMTAYVITQSRLPYRKAMTLFIILTMFVPGGMIPMFLLIKGIGIYNTLFAITLPPAFNVWYIMIMRANIQSTVANELMEAAYIDGANEYKVYFTIVLPLIKPILATIGLFAAVHFWNDFFGPLLYLNDGKKYPLTMILRKILLQGQMEQYHNVSRMSDQLLGLGPGYLTTLKFATIVVAVWPIMVVYPFVQKYFVKGIMVGSLKA